MSRLAICSRKEFGVDCGCIQPRTVGQALLFFIGGIGENRIPVDSPASIGKNWSSGVIWYNASRNHDKNRRSGQW